MPETISVIRRERVSDGEGGFILQDTTVATTRGRYATSSANELEIASRLGWTVQATIRMPFNHGIPGGLRETDRLRRSEDGRLYEVTGILDSSDALQSVTTALVRRL